MLDNVIGKQSWYVAPVWDSDDTGRTPLWNVIINERKRREVPDRIRPSVTVDDVPFPPQRQPIPERQERGIAIIDYRVRGAYLEARF